MFQRYYRILGITSKAGPEEVKRAYRRLAKKYHPDVNPDPSATQKFIDGTQAYERIIERLKRPNSYKYRYTKAAYHKQQKKKAAKKEHPRNRARRYSSMNYKKYKQKSSAYTDTHFFWFYRLFYYGMQLFVYILFFTIIFLSAWAFAVSLNPILLGVLAAAFYVLTKSFGFFKGWKKDFKNIFKDQ